jgi:hypothetical protein
MNLVSCIGIVPQSIMGVLCVEKLGEIVGWRLRVKHFLYIIQFKLVFLNYRRQRRYIILHLHLSHLADALVFLVLELYFCVQLV